MDTNTQQPAAETLDYNVVIELPKREGEDTCLTASIAADQVPPAARLALLKRAIGEVVKNRVNVAENRANKARMPFLAWALFDAAQAADPLQTAVKQPEGERPTGDAPALLDRAAKAGEAIADLLKGELNTGRGAGTSRDRTPVDPLIKAITGVVTQAVFASHQAAGTTIPVEGKAARKYSYPDAVKEVGRDGLAYLNAQIAAKVAAVPEAQRAALQAQLEKARDARYVGPASILIGRDQPGGKANQGLPSIL